VLHGEWRPAASPLETTALEAPFKVEMVLVGVSGPDGAPAARFHYLPARPPAHGPQSRVVRPGSVPLFGMRGARTRGASGCPPSDRPVGRAAGLGPLAGVVGNIFPGYRWDRWDAAKRQTPRARAAKVTPTCLVVLSCPWASPL
jgi:hypothetical protein